MKTKLTPILKDRFFSQYLHTCWCGDAGEEIQDYWNNVALISFLEAEQEQAFLILRPISSLTDEEAIEVAKYLSFHVDIHKIERDNEDGVVVYLNSKQRAIIFDDASGFSYEAKNGFWESYHVIHQDDVLSAFDYLRSIGIALPFMGHSVDELVEEGWVKLQS